VTEFYDDIKELTCPYCNHEQDVPHEKMDYSKEQQVQIVTCENCKKKFKAMVDFDPRFTSEIMESNEYLEI
jgi:transcription elongation factor Elf1